MFLMNQYMVCIYATVFMILVENERKDRRVDRAERNLPCILNHLTGHIDIL